MAAASDTSKKTVLLVDDDEGLLVLIGEALQAEGYRVLQAASGAEVLTVLAREKPALMLLDLKLKDVGGEVLLRQLKERNQLVPFIVVTGQGDEKIAVEMMREGALDYVSKDTALLDLLPGVMLRALKTVAAEKALQAETEKRRRLEAEIIEISENEQRRIGQDLHDGLGQQLTAIEILCTGLKSDVAKNPALTQQVDRIARFLRESISQVRSLARGLVPVGDEPDSLWSSLVELVHRTNALGLVECRMANSAVVLCANREVASQLYRIAQEAINNAVKHAGGARITVALTEREGLLELIVRDDGRGGATDRKDGLGLQIMRHRAAVIGAGLYIESTTGEGTTVSCRVSSKK